MLEKCVKDTYYAMFHTCSYHCCRETHFSTRVDVSSDQVSEMENLGHQVMVHNLRVGHGQSLCKVSHLQQQLLQEMHIDLRLNVIDKVD